MTDDCGTCETRERCTKPCPAVNAILWEDNCVMERHHQDAIVVYPQRGQVHMSALSPAQLDGLSDDHPPPWSSTDRRLTKTAVFIERFFHKTPCKELAERFGVEENTIVCIYAQAVEQLGRIVAALDARREGLKATKASPFTEDQRVFLLVCVFGYSRAEVARMFGLDHDRVCQRVKRLVDRYGKLFVEERTAEAGKKALQG